MKRTRIVERFSAERPDVEDFVRDVYAREYGADLVTFADRLICRRDPQGKILCVAGLRFAGDGFFSEAYLDAPVEAVLGRATGLPVNRDEVFEVTTLASRSPREIGAFVDDIIAFGARHDMGWAFFTLTQRLGQLIERRRLSPIFLADADPGRLANAAAWGRYYDTRPRVYGICGLDLRRRLQAGWKEVCHAGLV